MEQPPEDKRYVKGLAKGIIEELVKADLTMHEMQIEQWARIARFRPEGDDIPPDVMRGFGRKQYLSLKEVELELHVKPRSVPGFFKRVRQGFQVMFGKPILDDRSGVECEICSKEDDDAMKMTLRIQRLDDGKVKASYKPADKETSEMMTD